MTTGGHDTRDGFTSGQNIPAAIRSLGTEIASCDQSSDRESSHCEASDVTGLDDSSKKIENENKRDPGEQLQDKLPNFNFAKRCRTYLENDCRYGMTEKDWLQPTNAMQQVYGLWVARLHK